MQTLGEVESLFRNSEELRENIARTLLSSMVALFAVFDDHGRDRLELAGSGSFVMCDDSHYILTAAHVWEEVLKSAVKLGISLVENINQRVLIDISAIAPSTLKANGSGWDEWGPDLAMLEIPKALVGGIKAFRVFEDLKAPPKLLGVDALEIWIAIGTPKELGTFTRNYADVQMVWSLVDPSLHLRGAYDYYDFRADTTAPNMPSSFGGFSGGGLWRVLIYASPSTGQIDWAHRLKGVAFFEFPVENGYRIIRCHGPATIQALTENLAP
jgi:hypothetical protein